ncbi:MAG: lysoplasmalogenase [Clostridia bacterium]|nr:lysoplasmalogenase [Clostridia bacterium]
MNKIFIFLNTVLLVFTAVMCVVYKNNYQLWLKALTAFGFVAMGAVNFVHTLLSKKKKSFPLLAFFGLALCMAGDIILFKNFVLGAAVFVAGHVMYIAAYCALKKVCVTDLIVTAVTAAASLAFIFLCPAFDFGSAVMTAVAAIYALVISVMLGKAVSDFITERSLLHTIILLGSLMFFVSDIALAFNVFGGSPAWSNTLCLFTYFPGQCVIALSLYFYNTKSEKKLSY